MTISVLIPVHNSARTIRHTIEAVLHQTKRPDEILVMNDGGNDETLSILKSYAPHLSIFSQANQGVAAARNALCKLAKGELLAFLDADDIWHPRYLEQQVRLQAKYKGAAAFFTGHYDFNSSNAYCWPSDPLQLEHADEVILPLDFCRRYNRETAFFGSMSFCCLAKWVFTQLPCDPFCNALSGADDFFFFNLLPTIGAVALTTAKLVAYRCTNAGMSADLLRVLPLSVMAFENLERHFARQDKAMRHEFRFAFAARRRELAKVLMGAGYATKARRQLWRSVSTSTNPVSVSKSLALLACSYAPNQLQPKWPMRYRVGIPE